MAAVILDMDGLMLDTEVLSVRAWMSASQHFGVPLSRDVCRGMIGLGQSECRSYLRDHLEGDDRIDAIEAMARAHYMDALDLDGVPCKPGLFDFLEFLRARDIPAVVATSTITPLATRKLERVNALAYVRAVIGGDQVRCGKPAPDIFRKAAAVIGCASKDCIVLEDSGPGIRGASAAGMTVIWVPDLCEVDLQTRQLALTAPTLADAKPIIERLLQAAL